ncbi:MAG: TnsA endonuclease N-terminal domain-containing protein [Desulfuromonas sp.]|nr:TnsA endonuclease N-terminal domain-containing protein [Desulfuromonas sp.]
MATKKYSNSDVKNQKWIKEGRGSGRGKDYLPWLTVRDLPSSGRSHRIFGHKSQRTHHLFSDLELAVFFYLEFEEDTVEIREQFPLRLEETRALAEKSGIAHPSYQGALQIMSSDFLVNTNSVAIPKFALQAKYSDALQDQRTIEKLEIERRYWQAKGIPWMIITEQEIPRVMFENIAWLYPALSEDITLLDISERVDFYSYQLSRKADLNIIEIAKSLDVAYELEPGQSLLEIRGLLARRCFLFDLLIPSRKLKPSDLKIGDIKGIMENLRVSNQ